MAVVTVAVVDSAPFATKWEMPNNYQGIRSPIPRGLITYQGSDAIATLSAGDETSYQLSTVMPPGFAYLPRNISLHFQSDDLVNNFGLNGLMIYNFVGQLSNARRPTYNLTSSGEAIGLAVIARKVWVPGTGTGKLLLTGGDSIVFQLSDMDSGGSTAGSLAYYIEYYVFDIDQVDKWEVNTPIPVIAHTSF